MGGRGAAPQLRLQMQNSIESLQLTSPRGGIGAGMGQLPVYNGFVGGGGAQSHRTDGAQDFRINVQDPFSPVHRDIT